MSRGRQKIILREMCKSPGEYISTLSFAKQLNVSRRSIQNDIDTLRRNGPGNGFSIESEPSRGTRVFITDQKMLDNFLYEPPAEEGLNSQKGRINAIYDYLIDSSFPISLDSLCRLVYSSEGTVRNDLKKLQEILEPYSLKIRIQRRKVSLQGREVDKRVSLIRWDWIQSETPSDGDFFYVSQDSENYFSGLLHEEINRSEYLVSDIQFMNILAVACVSFARIRRHMFIGKEELSGAEPFVVERRIAENVYRRVQSQYNMEIPEEEVIFLSLYMGSHGSSQQLDFIPEDFQLFVREVLRQLDDIFRIPFSASGKTVDFLIVHSYLMVIRALNHIQFLNEFSDYVRQTYPYAHDAAVLFTEMITGKYHCRLSEIELSLLTLYFNKVIQNTGLVRNRHDVCVITTHRRPVCLNLEQILMRRFNDRISSITFLKPADATEEALAAYSVVLATEDCPQVRRGKALRIEYFPSEADLSFLQSLLRGYSREDVLSLIDPKLFWCGECRDRDELFQVVSESLRGAYGYELSDYGFREYQTYTSGYYGHGIAIVHPMHDLPRSAFGVFVLKQPIRWEEKNEPVLLMLVNGLRREDILRHRLMDLLSQAVFQPSFYSAIPSIDSYEKLIALLAKNLR